MGCDLTENPIDNDASSDLWNANQYVGLPFVEEQAVRVSQGFHGHFSHDGIGSAYAVDFPVPEGTPITAAKSGTVISVRFDSSTGCGNDSCVDDNNYIVIDHGDGTIGKYLHLEQNGVDVKVGETVCRGQVIGKSGNTGFSSGPHLHFEVENLIGESIPVLFDEFKVFLEDGEESNSPGARVDGAPILGKTVVSKNAPQACAEQTLSSCNDIFVNHGVRLSSKMPCTLIEAGRDYILSGTYYGDSDSIVVSQKDTVNNDWLETCIPVERSSEDSFGQFTGLISWPTESFKGYSFLHIGGNNPKDGDACRNPSYSRSVYVSIVE